MKEIERGGICEEYVGRIFGGRRGIRGGGGGGGRG